MAQATFSVRMDEVLKKQFDELCREFGMNASTAINIFARAVVRERGIPFEICDRRPNKETVAAMLEAERIARDPTVKGYTDMDELFRDLRT